MHQIAYVQPAACAGEQTREILVEAGYADDVIDSMLVAGVVSAE